MMMIPISILMCVSLFSFPRFSSIISFFSSLVVLRAPSGSFYFQMLFFIAGPRADISRVSHFICTMQILHGKVSGFAQKSEMVVLT